MNIRNVITGETSTIAANGIFVAIGHSPATAFIDGIVQRDGGWIYSGGRRQHTHQHCRHFRSLLRQPGFGLAFTPRFTNPISSSCSLMFSAILSLIPDLSYTRLSTLILHCLKETNSMNRNKKVYSCIVCFHCLLIRRFIHICRTGVLHIQAMSSKISPTASVRRRVSSFSFRSL